MRLFFTHQWIDIYLKRKKITIKSISLSDVKNMVCFVDVDSFVLGFSSRSDDLLLMWERRP